MACAVTGGLKNPRPRLMDLAEAGDRWPELISYLDQAPAGTVVGLCRDNDPVLALLAWERYQGLLLSLEILADPDLGPAVRSGLAVTGRGPEDLSAASPDGPPRVLLTPEARAALAAVGGGRTGAALLKSLAGLGRAEPGDLALAGPLAGCFCREVVGDRFRLVYRTGPDGRGVVLLAIGFSQPDGRRGAAELAGRLLEPNL